MSYMEVVRQKQLEDEQKAQDFRMAKEMEMKIILYSIIHDQGKNHNCVSSEACPICNATLILKSMAEADWERFIEPMAKIVCAVSAAVFLLMRVTNGALGLNSASWRGELGQLVADGEEHHCGHSLCVIGDAIKIARAVSDQARVEVIATLAEFLTIIDAAGQLAEDMEQEQMFHNPN